VIRAGLLAVAACGSSASAPPVVVDRDWRCFVVDPRVTYTGGRSHETHVKQRLSAQRLETAGVTDLGGMVEGGSRVYQLAGDHYDAPEGSWPPSRVTLQAPDGTRWTATLHPDKDESRRIELETRIDASGMTVTQRRITGDHAEVDFDDVFVPAPCSVVDAALAKAKLR
jgi:hypothetical protein